LPIETNLGKSTKILSFIEKLTEKVKRHGLPRNWGYLAKVKEKTLTRDTVILKDTWLKDILARDRTVSNPLFIVYRVFDLPASYNRATSIGNSRPRFGMNFSVQQILYSTE
jgi:hypothetical protein